MKSEEIIFIVFVGIIVVATPLFLYFVNKENKNN